MLFFVQRNWDRRRVVELFGEKNLDALVEDLDVPSWVDERCEYRPPLRTQTNTVHNVYIKYIDIMGLCRSMH